MTVVLMHRGDPGRSIDTAPRVGSAPAAAGPVRPSAAGAGARPGAGASGAAAEATQPRELTPPGEATAPPQHAGRVDDSGGPLLQWRGPSKFVWRQVPLTVDRLPAELDGLRILHLSDFHTRRYWPPAYDALLERIAHDPPDLIAFTGDFVESRRDHMPAVPHVKRLVAGFRARLGCYGTLGNHDLYHFAPHLDDTNVTLLEGARKVIHLPNASIELIGIPGVDRADLADDFLRALPPRGERTLRVVLSHFPDHVRRTRHLRPDLILAGHTHGGQVCLPGGVPIITHARLPRRLASGIHRLGDTWLVVNRGLGFSGLPLRVLCPSEVVELVLRTGEMKCET